MRCWDISYDHDGYHIVIYELPAWRRLIEWACSYTPLAGRSRLAYRLFTWATIQAHSYRQREIVVPLDQAVRSGPVVPTQLPAWDS